MIRWLLLLTGMLPACLCAAGGRPADLTLPPGFSIEVFAEVDNARQMALGKRTLFVGSRTVGKVYAIPIVNHRAGKPIVIASDLNMPVGVAFRDGDLYVSAVNRILRFRNIESRLNNPPTPEVITDRYPAETHHGWKFIAFGPDGKLYVPVGAPCNICEPDPDRYATITRLDVQTGKIETIARGVRNTVGFDWHPGTNELWFTDNGRDWLGDDLPPDELNRLEKTDQHFGYPYCHGGTIADPEFNQRNCREFTPPALNLGAHVAPLGMRFYTGNMFPKAYRNAIFIAEHGSWNRSRKSGYRVMVATLEGNRVVKYQPFVSGWLSLQQTLGRPADVLVLPDGSLLISDDHAGVIYRVTYRAEKSKIEGN
ncbi:MAG: sorbosone dehydrogenase family protein [Hydrogenophilaceae bacterium]|nr:sorbosone dehydrogenase family protein [Hydrogenophilaceae bacterium]